MLVTLYGQSGSREVKASLLGSSPFIKIGIQPMKVSPTLREERLSSAKPLWTFSQTYPKVCSLHNSVSHKAESED